MKIRLKNDYISMSDYCIICNNCFNRIQGYVSLSCNSNIIYVEAKEHLFCTLIPQLLLSPEPVNTTIPNCIINKDMQNFVKLNDNNIHADLYFHTYKIYPEDQPMTYVIIAAVLVMLHTFMKYVKLLCMSRRLRLQAAREANYAPIVDVDKFSEVCTICIEEFKQDEKVRKLKCGHEFHIECIDEWKQRGNRTCPNCNENFMQNISV